MMSPTFIFFFALVALASANPQGQVESEYIVPVGCGHPDYTCVPDDLCKNGIVVTDGAGGIDLRFGPSTGTKQSECSDPTTDPNSPQGRKLHVCCRNDYEVIVGHNCPIPYSCVDYETCIIASGLNTDGSGLIDVRNAHDTCWTDTGYVGVCCHPQPLEVCPVQSVCVPEANCRGTAYDLADEFGQFVTGHTYPWRSCHLQQQDYGVCCISSQIETCPRQSQCVADYECFSAGLQQYTEDTFIAYTDGADYKRCYLDGFVNGGICCRGLDYCPGDGSNDGSQVCLPFDHCKRGTVRDYARQSYIPYPQTSLGLVECIADLHGKVVQRGICCIPPPICILPPADRCGVRNRELNTRITTAPYSGLEAKFGEFPWQAIIFNRDYAFISGATLISNRYVLTAAHNLYSTYNQVTEIRDPSDLRVRLGEWQVNSFEEPQPYVDFEVLYVTPHFAYNHAKGNAHNDLAILELASPVEFKYHISPICMPPQGTLPLPATRCFVTGWGKDSFGDDGSYQQILKKVDVPYLDKATCQEWLRQTKLGKGYILDKSFVCAGGEEGKDACTGDGGGPLVCDYGHNGDYVLTGLTAFGVGCGQYQVPGVYVDVAHFADWIYEITVWGQNAPHYTTHVGDCL